MALLDDFQSHLRSLHLSPATAVVAVSGGADSVALLDLLVRSSAHHGLTLVVAHVDHGIHPESGQVARAVRALAAGYHLPYLEGKLGLGPGAGETAARVQRYRWLEEARRRSGAAYLLTAHHADDQVETVLMRALRGSGPAGLAGMAARRGALVRPLLPFRRARLVAYVEAAGLTAWDDPANADPRHLRSWIRASLLPMIRRELPDVDRQLGRLAEQAARDRTAWDVMLEVLPALAFRREDDGVSLDAGFLGSASPALAERLLLAAAERAGCQLGPRRAARALGLVRPAGRGSTVPLGGGWRAAVSFRRLHIVAPEAIVAPQAKEATDADEPWTVEGAAGERRWGRWLFRWSREPAPQRQPREGSTAWFAPAPLAVGRWTPGQRVRPLAGAGHRPVAQCLQERQVPRWRRAGWPVVIIPGEPGDVVWVPGVCRSDQLMPVPGADALRIDVRT